MPTVSSTEGSPTNTQLERRSRAASFSMYPAVLVEGGRADEGSSPRASIGLIMLPASIAPSPVALALTMVCNPSMKVMICPADSFDLVEDGLEAFLELAAVLRTGDHGPQVQEMTVLSRRLSGTSPSMMRWAGPRRSRSYDAWFTDEHRVVLGATAQHLDDAANLVIASDNRISLPRETRAVRSVEYFSSAWYFASGRHW